MKNRKSTSTLRLTTISIISLSWTGVLAAPPVPPTVNVNVVNVPDVTIANTQDDPIPVTQTTAAAECMPENIVELYSNVGIGELREFQIIDADGVEGLALVLSPGEVLVVTDVLVTPNLGNSAPGQYAGNIDNSPPGGGSLNRIRLLFNSGYQGMLHLPFSSGVVFRQPPRAFAFATNPAAMVIRLLGCIDRELTP
jgi:hypothetical protein